MSTNHQMIERSLTLNEAEDDMLIVAFASSDQLNTDQHFGSCRTLSLYGVTPGSSKHLKVVEFSSAEGHNLPKIIARLEVLSGCFAVYCLACGNPVRKQLLDQGTRAVTIEIPQPIKALIAQFQQNWPGKVALRQQRITKQRQQASYFDDLTESAWDPD